MRVAIYTSRSFVPLVVDWFSSVRDIFHECLIFQVGCIWGGGLSILMSQKLSVT
jgi:putative lipase involved disintegration of autophagic bodies